MREFLDEFLDDNREFSCVQKLTLEKEFNDTISIAHSALGDKAFRVGTSLNAAIFDSVMIGIAKRLQRGPIRDKKSVEKTYLSLLDNKGYEAAYVRATSDDESVRSRLKIATDAFSAVP
jgi:hypothetical protein